MSYVDCPCGVRLRYVRTHSGFAPKWGGDEINGCEEMRLKREAEPAKQHPIGCERSLKLIVADADRHR